MISDALASPEIWYAYAVSMIHLRQYREDSLYHQTIPAGENLVVQMRPRPISIPILFEAHQGVVQDGLNLFIQQLELSGSLFNSVRGVQNVLEFVRRP